MPRSWLRAGWSGRASSCITVKGWRKVAMGYGHMSDAYRNGLVNLQARITPDNVASRQQVLLKALDELVAQGLFE
jgi:hypothetical protein